MPESWIAHGYLQESLERRERDLLAIGSNFDAHGNECLPATNSMKSPNRLLEFLLDSRYSVSKRSLPATLVPLNECILAILWELEAPSSSCHILRGERLDDFLNLLGAAAQFQANIETICNRVATLKLSFKVNGLLQDQLVA
jgi:hypothetical protein